MREIKFRVWHKPTKQFVKQDIFYLDKPSFIGQLSVGLDGTLIQAGMYDDYSAVSNPEDYAIQQYTGLTDRNGQEIYEGDILGYPENRNDETMVEIRWAEAYSGEQWCEFDIRDYKGQYIPGGKLSDFYGGVHPDYRVVVGNIFEGVDK